MSPINDINVGHENETTEVVPENHAIDEIVASEDHSADQTTSSEHAEGGSEEHGSVHIAIAPEVVAHIGSFGITNTFITSLIISFLLIAIVIKTQVSKFNIKSKFYNLVEMVVEGINSVVESVIGRQKVAKVLVMLIGTYFLFIIFNNWLGIMPFVGSLQIIENGEKMPFLRSTFSDLNMTLTFALMSVIIIQALGFGISGIKGYGAKFINLKSPIMFFVGILEIISEFVKVFSFSFRLFGNIFAGEVLLAVMYFLTPYLVPIPFLGIELFAGFIQALIFSMLSLVFIKSAIEHHH